MTPLEETIQRLMAPDKHGDKGEPVRTAIGSDCFWHPLQRTLDALWKFAEGVAAASKDSTDHYDQAVARIRELEAWIRGAQELSQPDMAERARCRRLMDRCLNEAWEKFAAEINPK